MKINFKKIHIHHFLSFDDSEIELNDKGYCLVKGVNKNPKDAAKSNGSGKSTIFNAISYVLTGETLQGLKSNLANIYYNDGCWVSIEFTADGVEYKLTRSKDDKDKGTNLKVVVNGEDKSGKGIRESQVVLDTYLPDLTSELIGSVIILGQGLPQKFTSNSPAGRKEVLEHLSKSDFMIKDTKERIDNRLSILSNKNRTYEDALLSIDSKRNVYQNQLTINNDKLSKLNEKSLEDFDSLIDTNTKELDRITNEIKQCETDIQKLNEDKETYNKSVLEATQLKEKRTSVLNEEYNKYDKEYSNKKTELTFKINTLNKEIRDIQNIKEVCPTCGRPFDNVVKPSTVEKEKEVSLLTEELKNLNLDIEDNNTQYRETLDEIKNMFNNETSKAQAELTSINNKLFELNNKYRTLNSESLNKNNFLNSLKNEKTNYTNNLKEVNNAIEQLNKSINELDVEEKDNISLKSNNQAHIDVVNKMRSLVQRDFRGVLLKNVIDYINERAKNYCSKIFNTNEIEFKLDGTNIDIVFCNKDYENLSGGEKQRVDLITQFSIRDMMCKYLDFSSNILVLDEITDALDSVSCDKVINFITNELNDIESTFIISHHSDELEIPYDCEMVIVKNELGLSEVI